MVPMHTSMTPDDPALISTMPSIVPMRIAMNVPVSTSALPPISSSRFRCWGRIAYLIGPNTVECSPIMKRAVSSNARWCERKPIDPITMIAISNSFMYWMKRDFSYLSAS